MDRPGDQAMTQPTISDAAVQAKTGRVWTEWFTLLDAEGAAGLAHREIAVALREQHGLSGWWSQMVTVAYEQARGRREPHQTSRGYQVGVSKTVPVNVDVPCLLPGRTQPSRQPWLGDEAITIRRATRPKSMRITWSDGQTNLDVSFWDKGPDQEHRPGPAFQAARSRRRGGQAHLLARRPRAAGLANFAIATWQLAADYPRARDEPWMSHICLG